MSENNSENSIENKVQIPGIDISKWQGNIDWPLVKEAGVEFVMVRLGHGLPGTGRDSGLDPKFYDYLNGARKVGIARGIYFRSTAKDAGEALKETEFCLTLSKGLCIEYPFALILGEGNVSNNDQIMKICEVFCGKIKNSGCQPMICIDKTWLDKLNPQILANNKCDIWYRNYSVTKPDMKCSMWQLSNANKVDGITENKVALDYSYKDYAEITKRNCGCYCPIL